MCLKISNVMRVRFQLKLLAVYGKPKVAMFERVGI